MAINKLLSENLKAKINHGPIPMVNVEQDYFKKVVPFDSWFYIGHFEAEGHVLNFLFHQIVMDCPGVVQIINSNVTITDETTGWYKAESQTYPLEVVQISTYGEGADMKQIIKCPNGTIDGNIYGVKLQAALEGGSIEMELDTYGMPMYNTGTAVFLSCFGKQFGQYSIPHMMGKGAITMDGKTYPVEGKVWFDRQFDVAGAENINNFDGLYENSEWSWAWMDINLSNGDTIGLWDMNFINKGVNNTWATVLHPDGTQSVVTVENLKVSEGDYYDSEIPGRRYPTRWTVRIPELDAELEVVSAIKNQEVVSQIPLECKYEGASTIKGTYRGEEVTGYCYVEMIGSWS